MARYSIYFCEDAIGTPIEEQEDILFWRLDLPELKLLSATLDMEINKAGKLTFQMPYTHPYAKKVHKKRTRFYVARGKTPIWSGRVLDTDRTFYKAISVTVEGALTYLLDTIQRPYTFEDILDLAIEKGHIYVPPTQKVTTMETKHLLYFLIYNHNKEADDDKKFIFDLNEDIIGNSDKEEDNFNSNFIKKRFKSEEYSNSKDEFNEAVISKYGGFIILEYNKNTHKNHFKYCLSDEGIISPTAQTIEFGKNLIDFSETVTSENIYTRCIPLGATYNDFENLRKKAYDAVKKEYNDAIKEYNAKKTASKKADKAAAERRKKDAEDACGYTAYKEALAKYNAQKYKYDQGIIKTEPEKPEKVSPPKTSDGRTKTLKDYGYDSSSPQYDRMTAEDNMDSWEDSGYAMPKSVDGNTKVTADVKINLWYMSPWSVTKKSNVNDYVVYNNEDIKLFGKITQSVDVNVSLPSELPNSKSKCDDVYDSYIISLKKQGRKWLKKNHRMNTTLKVSAFDLKQLDPNNTDDSIDYIDVGYSIPVVSEPHNLKHEGVSLLCSACSLNLIERGQSDFTIGAVFKALTDRSVVNKEQSGKAYGLARSSYTL